MYEYRARNPLSGLGEVAWGARTSVSLSLLFAPLGLSGYGYLPTAASTPATAGLSAQGSAADRLTAAAAAAAYYGADYTAMPTGNMAASQMAVAAAAAAAAGGMASHMAAAAVPRSDPSPLPLSTSPLLRESLHRAAPSGTFSFSFIFSVLRVLDVYYYYYSRSSQMVPFPSPLV